MLRSPSIYLLAGLLTITLTSLMPVLAQQRGELVGPDRSEFNVISEKNIFDPNRSARVARTEREEPAGEPVVESFTLLGTMSYEKGQFAFFGGSKSDFKKVLKPADEIAGFTIAEIGADKVKLEDAGKAVELRVGMAMKRQDEGEWQTSRDAPRTENRSRESGSRGSSSPAQTESTPSAEESDILKRLLERRQQEIQK